MTEELKFTDEEIRRQLELLGFRDVSHQQLQLFKSELEELLLADNNARNENIENVEYRQFDDESVDHVNIKPKSTAPVLIEKVPVEELNFCPNTRWSEYRKQNLDHIDRWEDLRLQMNSKSRNWTRNGDHGTNNSDSNSQFTSISSDVSSSSSRPQIRKRKVLRKKHGKVNVEVYESSGANTKSSLELNSCDTNSETNRSSEAVSSTDEVPKRWKSVSDLGITKKSIYRSKSVLLPYTNNTQAHVYYKSDPVALFHYYKREWSNFNIPGEKDHRELRWNIRQTLSRDFSASRK